MRSITWRLTIWYTVILVIILLVSGLAAFLGMRYVLYTDAIRELESSTITVLELIKSSDQHHSYANVNLDDPALKATPDRFLWIQVTLPDGRVLKTSSSLENGVFTQNYIGPPIIRSFGVQRTEGELLALIGHRT